MRLIRAAGQNVSPSDDGRLYDQIFSDGLFTDTAFAALGTNNVQVGAMYGDLCGRDFTIEQQTIAVPLPEGDGETTGYIYVEIDTSAETPLSVGATLAPFTPTYEDINVNGAVAQMIVAEYTASAVAVTSVTATYTKAAAGSVKAGSIATVESSPVTANHAIGEYILYGGTVYRVTAAIATGETIVPGTNVIAESVGDALTSLNNGLTPNYLQERIVGYLGNVPIYSVTFTGLTLNNARVESLANLNIDTVVRIYGSARRNFNGYWMPVPFYDNSSNKCTVFYETANKQLIAWTDSAYSNGTITIEYTKAV